MNSSKVELVYKEGKGRCMITNEDVSQGDILFVWKPYIIVPYVTEKEYLCANCMHISKEQSKINEMIPCRQNCFNVYYCSDKCEKEHWNEFHQYECLFMNKIYSLKDFGYNDEVINYTRLVMRMLTHRLQEMLGKQYDISIEDIWIGRSHFEDFNIDKIKEFETVAKILTEYILTKLIHHITKDNQEFIDIIQSFLPHSTDIDKFDINNYDTWINDMIRSVFISNDSNIIQLIKCLLKKVFILICIEEINALFHITFILEGYFNPPSTYAMGMYPSAAFVNHSCSPNLARFPVQYNKDNYHVGDVVFFATRSIKKGDEVFYSYLEREYQLYINEQINSNDIINSPEKRKQKLKDEFFFDCNCQRCANESKGILDISYMNLVKQLKCTRSKCKGWFIPNNEKSMHCEACRQLR